MAGYIAMSILFKDNTNELGIMINSIRNDLFNRNSFSQSMALTLACNLNNIELIDAIAESVFTIVTKYQERQPYIIKKALITLGKIFKMKKDLHDPGRLAGSLYKMVDMSNFEWLLSIATLVYNCVCMFGTNGYEKVIIRLLNDILHSFIEKKKDCPDEYIYYHIKCPWLQIKILKILELCDTNMFDDNSLNNLKEYIDYFGKKSKTIVTEYKRFQRYYAEYCIFFEIVNVIDHYNLKMHFKVFDTYVGILGSFLMDDSKRFPNTDINTKYLALDGMAKLSKYSNGNKI
jgi:hypothetical protein